MYVGRVDAYIKLELDPRDVVQCYDERGRDIYLYPDRDLVIQPYMKAVKAEIRRDVRPDGEDKGEGILWFFGAVAIAGLATVGAVASSGL